jgi:hypothetical protein
MTRGAYFIGVLLLGACTCDIIGNGVQYACKRDDECAAGFVCGLGVCREPGTFDAGPVDSGVPDSGGPDSGTPDAGPPDAGPFDAGTIDAGDPCGKTVIMADAGLLPVYCALHKSITIDGDLTDWTGVPFTPLNRANAASVLGLGLWPSDVDGGNDDSDLSGFFAMQWDAQYLYIAGTLVDDARALHSGDAYYEDDCFQVYLDGNHDRSGPFEEDDLDLLIRADNAPEQYVLATGVNILALPDGGQSATADTGDNANWNVEIAVPWSRLGPNDAGPGRVFGFDLIIDDDDDPMTQIRKHYLIWQQNSTDMGCSEPYCSTTAFGDAVLTGAP